MKNPNRGEMPQCKIAKQIFWFWARLPVVLLQTDCWGTRKMKIPTRGEMPKMKNPNRGEMPKRKIATLIFWFWALLPMVLLEIDFWGIRKMNNPTRAEMPKNEKSKARRYARKQNSKTDILILGSPAYGFVRNRFLGYPQNEKSNSRREAQQWKIQLEARCPKYPLLAGCLFSQRYAGLASGMLV